MGRLGKKFALLLEIDRLLCADELLSTLPAAAEPLPDAAAMTMVADAPPPAPAPAESP